jgi:hypothetical protein
MFINLAKYREDKKQNRAPSALMQRASLPYLLSPAHDGSDFIKVWICAPSARSGPVSVILKLMTECDLDYGRLNEEEVRIRAQLKERQRSADATVRGRTLWSSGAKVKPGCLLAFWKGPFSFATYPEYV